MMLLNLCDDPSGQTIGAVVGSVVGALILAVLALVVFGIYR